MFFKSKHIVTLLDDKWQMIKSNVNLSAIPKQDELMYIDEFEKYYRIMYVIHHLHPKHNVVLVLREFTHDIKVNLEKK